MPEAVIVSVARSPIGRAVKGSLAALRPDDMAAQMVRAALGRVPELDPATLDDVMLGCGQPAGEAGYNLARVTALLAGLDVPGTTVNRYCASSLQTTRMAFHAIKAGEGDAFLSVGVEAVSRYAQGASDGSPGTRNARFAEAGARTAARSTGGAEVWTDPALDGILPDVYIAMGQTAENVAQIRGVSRLAQDEFGVRSQNLAEAAIANGFWATDIVPLELPGRHRGVGRRRTSPRSHPREGLRARTGLPPRRHGDRRQLLPAERRCRSRGGDVRRACRRGSASRRSRASSPRGSALSRRRSWASAPWQRRSRRSHVPA